MSKTQTSAQVPKLRFPGFEGEWKDVAMGELLSFKNGYNADKEQYGTGVKFINVLDIIQNDYITHDRIIGSVTIPEKDFEKNEVRYGDLLFQRSSETREEVGQANVYLDKDTPATFGGFVIRGRPLKEFDSVYFNALLKTAKVRKDMTSRSGGATRYNIGQDSLEEVTVNLSPFLPEQQKIAAFLTAVDGRIEQLSRKKALLEAYKKGVMQQLFTQTLRFQDDHGHDFPDWEEADIAEVASLTSGYAFESEQFGSSGCKLITPKNFTKTGFAAFDEQNTKFTTEKAPQRFHCKPGDLLVLLTDLTPTCELLGSPVILRESDGEVLLNQRIVKVVPDSRRLLTPFLGYYFQTSSYRRRIVETSVGSTVRHSSNKILQSTKVQLPSLPEQTKIAGFLSALDGKIGAVGEQMRQTQAWKKGLLQQMFV